MSLVSEVDASKVDLEQGRFFAKRIYKGPGSKELQLGHKIVFQDYHLLLGKRHRHLFHQVGTSMQMDLEILYRQINVINQCKLLCSQVNRRVTAVKKPDE